MEMIVSEGTLRPQDLIPAFFSTLKYLNEEDYNDLLKEYPEFADIEEELTPIQIDLVGEVLDDLYCRLNENAPQGTCFGAHEGDGALFGFWEFPREEGITI